MAWRVHLANQAIRTLHILLAKAPVLGAWTRPDHIELFDLETGASLGAKTFAIQPATAKSDYWAQFTVMDSLYVPALHQTWLTEDGKRRTQWSGDSRLSISHEEVQTLLTLDARPLALEQDRQQGIVAFIEAVGTLRFVQNGTLSAPFDIGLQPTRDHRIQLLISRGGQTLYATDGTTLVAINGSGKVRKRITAHYDIGTIACSPTGTMLVTTDTESGVMRVYRGEDLVQTHQKFSIDLVAKAQQVQLIADLPPSMTTVSSLAVYVQGVIAFAMAGVVCVSDTIAMDELPRSRR